MVSSKSRLFFVRYLKLFVGIFNDLWQIVVVYVFFFRNIFWVFKTDTNTIGNWVNRSN